MRPRIVIIGGGFGGVETFHRLHRLMHKRHGIDVTLIDQKNYFLFTPMLHELATGSIGRNHVTQPLREMVDCCHERFVRAKAERIDRTRRVVVTDAGNYPYDYCVIAVGSRASDFGVPGVTEHALPLKTVNDCAAVRNHLVACFEAAARARNKTEREQRVHFVIVGGGATGVELAGQMGDLFRKEMRALYTAIPCDEVRITIVESGERVLQRHSEFVGTAAMRKLKELGVSIIVNTRVVRVEKDRVHLKNGDHLEACTIIWTSGVQSNADALLPREDLDERGRVRVNEFLRMMDDDHVFALGDCAVIADTGMGVVPQTAQAAVAEAKGVARNVRRLVRKKEPVPYRHSVRGELVPIGNWFGIAELGPIRFTGRVAWLMRRGVFLLTMYSWPDRFRIALDWFLNTFSFRDTSEL
ncbi:MAG: NAD(P)/FAD-dependent oxidoreductase [Candidatus Magasanikbacteria bacterium]|nr:NAD(P)/FAD-dependent oxidoreductase [Candidatus Magasanikbacteria bacterium]